MAKGNIDERVAVAAARMLERDNAVSTVDVLLAVGWLQSTSLERWRQRRLAVLEEDLQVSAAKLDEGLRAFRAWVAARGLTPLEVVYVAQSVQREPLRFSKSGDEARAIASSSVIIGAQRVGSTAPVGTESS